jgi:hypothetical protein
MARDYLAEFESSLIGHSCSVSRREYEESPGEYDWDFLLNEHTGLSSYGDPWRIVVEGRIALASADDGHKFGHQEPISGEAVARALLGTRPILRATVDRQTGDLSLHFNGATRLDVFRNSAGYEGWRAGYMIDGQRWEVIALGGGDLSFFSHDAR